jgi:ribosomal protein S18 acetylase RimI-like enzyme
MGVDVRAIGRGERGAAIAVSSRAFFDDPNFHYFQPNPVRQMRMLPHFFRAAIYPNLPFDATAVAVDGDRVVGVGSWLPPGAHPLDRRAEVLRYALGAPAVPLLGRRLPHAIKLLETIERLHIHEPHWYLAVLAVDPEYQRRGIGAQLLEPVLSRCDADGLLAYLETQKPENVAWYRRFGFEVRDEVHVRGTGCAPNWTMLREPR